MATLPYRLKKIMLSPMFHVKHRGFNKWKLYHLLKFFLCLVLFFSTFCLGISQCVNVEAADTFSSEEVEYSYLEVNGKQYGYQDTPYDVAMGTSMDFKMWLSTPTEDLQSYRVTYSWDWTSSETDYLVSSSLRPYYNNKTYDNSMLGIGVVQTYTYGDGSQKVNTYKGYNDSTKYCEINYNDASNSMVTCKMEVTLYYLTLPADVNALGLTMNNAYSSGITRSVLIKLNSESPELIKLRQIANSEDKIYDWLSGGGLGGLLDNLSNAIGDFFNNLANKIKGFFEDLLNGIIEFLKTLLIPTTEDIQTMIDDFDAFWGDSVLTMPLEFSTKIVAVLHTHDFSNVYNSGFEVPRWYMTINGSNHKIWDKHTLNLLPQGGHVDYILTHDFRSSSYPYVNANNARYGLFLAFWIFAIFKVIKVMCNMLGILGFIFNPVTDELTEGDG